ncbi:hypothetical protein FKM82_001998 [Ascaphus truei]
MPQLVVGSDTETVSSCAVSSAGNVHKSRRGWSGINQGLGISGYATIGENDFLITRLWSQTLFTIPVATAYSIVISSYDDNYVQFCYRMASDDTCTPEEDFTYTVALPAFNKNYLVF